MSKHYVIFSIMVPVEKTGAMSEEEFLDQAARELRDYVRHNTVHDCIEDIIEDDEVPVEAYTPYPNCPWDISDLSENNIPGY